MFTTLIIDDEKKQQDILTNLISKNFPEYQILGCCSNVEESLKLIKSLKPQLIFLDVLIPPYTGFDILRQVDQATFEVIFATSHEEYALNALRVSAVDFLLKPFNAFDLKNSLDKFESRFNQKLSHNHIELLMENIKQSTAEKMRIALPTFKGYVFIHIGEILYCESDNNYTTFYLQNSKNILVSKSLKECEEMLGEWDFFRVQNSFLINMRYIKEYERSDGGQVKMIDGKIIYVSRRRKEDFLKSFSKL